MLYLEDYLEMIEHLPSELRDRFTEMREMDLSVQNQVDILEQKQKSFFANCKRNRNNSSSEGKLNEDFEKIRREYQKLIEDSSEKIQTAEESYNLVDRYLRKLDQELHKFKMELEADNRGITEFLEKRSLEMDNPVSNTSKENRLPKKQSRKSHTTIAHPPSTSNSLHSLGFGLDPSLQQAALGTPGTSGTNKNKNPFLFPDPTSSPIPGLDPSTLSSPGALTYPLQHMGAGGNAIAAAASQAIAATQQLVPGRRTSSLKASFEAINMGVQTHEFSIGRELAGAAQSALAATLNSDAGPSNKRQKVSKRNASHVDPGTPSSSTGVLDVVSANFMDDSFFESGGNSPSGNSPADDLLGIHGRGGDAAGTSEQDWNLDPNEPRYCVCNQVSYGDMVACDNERDCPYEWFHYPCVGITSPPKGKWYCPTCLARRKGRK